MIAVANPKVPAVVNRMAKSSGKPVDKPRDIAAELEADRRARLEILARDSIWFELSAYKMGVELIGTYEIDDVPRWLGGFAREVWIMLPSEYQGRAERYLKRLSQADLPAINGKVSKKLYDACILETLQSLTRLCSSHAVLSRILSEACTLLALDPDSTEWERIHEEAFQVHRSEPEGSAMRSVADAICAAANRDSYSPLWSWSHAEIAFGRPKFREPDRCIRRPLSSLTRLSRRVFKLIREGHRLIAESTPRKRKGERTSKAAA